MSPADRRRAAPPRVGDRRPPGRGSALAALLDETRVLFHRLRVVAEEVHGEGEMSAGRRGVLRDLARHGPQSVPQLARRRPVSRQLIQSLVNPLVEDGWVELVPNPAHRRSPLVRLTPAGESRVAAMALRETALLARLETGLTEREVARAAQVLRAVRAGFESRQWKEFLADSARPGRKTS